MTRGGFDRRGGAGGTVGDGGGADDRAQKTGGACAVKTTMESDIRERLVDK